MDNAVLMYPRFSDEEARSKARVFYIEMKIIKLDTVARAVGRPKEVIEQWLREDCWIADRTDYWDQRNGKAKRKLERLLRQVRSPQESAIAQLKNVEMADEIIQKMLCRPTDRNSAADIKVLGEAQLRFQEAEVKAMARLKLENERAQS